MERNRGETVLARPWGKSLAMQCREDCRGDGLLSGQALGQDLYRSLCPWGGLSHSFSLSGGWGDSRWQLRSSCHHALLRSCVWAGLTWPCPACWVPAHRRLESDSS